MPHRRHPPHTPPAGAGQDPDTALRRSGKAGHLSPGRMTNGLVALAATAVIAVYSAGFLRTKAAADELEAPGIRRPPQTPPPLHEVIPALDIEPPPETRPEALAAPAPVSAEPARSASTADGEPSAPSATAPAGDPAKTGDLAKTGEPAPKATKTTPRPTAETRPASTGKPIEAATPVTTSAAGLAGAVVGSSAAAGEATPDPAPPPVVSPPPPSSTAPPQPTLPEPDNYPAPAVLYKDGTYTGWGTSRHGDIQATVVIEGGRIASAKISECWTRYPCSWIAKLPPQVAERQSPEVDFVSGATQSTNAFYYAVIQALAKAK